MKKTIGIVIALMVISLTSGCGNTVNGAGQDLQHMGEWMQKKS